MTVDGADLVVCRSSDLVERGPGQRFLVPGVPEPQPAFVIRYQGRLRAFLNRCPHAGHELDWQAGEFFDREGRALVCASHGARYDPADGACLSGPCQGRGLTLLEVAEQGGRVVINARMKEVGSDR